MKRQIVEFNRLLEQQVRMMQIQETGATPLPTSNGSLVQQSECALLLSYFLCLSSPLFFCFTVGVCLFPFFFFCKTSYGFHLEMSCFT